MIKTLQDSLDIKLGPIPIKRYMLKNSDKAILRGLYGAKAIHTLRG